MKVSWDDDIPNIWENKTCSRPPTRLAMSQNLQYGILGGHTSIYELFKGPRGYQGFDP